jgi:ABC-type nitrate/sulfonate/bicarbonate transport system permease component
MDVNTLSKSTINSHGFLLTLLFFFTLFFLFAVILALVDAVFVLGFGIMVLQIAIVSVVGGAIGLGLAELVLISEWITSSTIRFLRLGMWLPFFAAWASPTWWIPWDNLLKVSGEVKQILAISIPTLPTVIFAACYYYLSARHTLQLHRGRALMFFFRPTFLHALFFALLAQLFLHPAGWQWPLGFLDEGNRISQPTAAVLLLAGCLFILFSGIGPGFAKTADTNAISTLRQIHTSKPSSLFGAAALWLFCFAIWDFFAPLLRDLFAIAPLRNVIRSAYSLLTIGSTMPNMDATIWFNVAVSAQEIAIGLLLGGVLAFFVVQVIRVIESTIRLSWLLAFTHSSPIVIAIAVMPLVGIGIGLKAVIVAAASLFPFTETLWGLRNSPLPTRILLALKRALPYAFVGMFFAELWASTAGLGFFIVVARAVNNKTEALAAALIAFALMVAVSVCLTFVIKRLGHSKAELT